MIVTHKIETDLCRRGLTSKLDMVQGDSNSRKIEITLKADREPWEPPADAEVTLRYRKPDGSKGSAELLNNGTSYTVNGNVVTVLIASSVLTDAGEAILQAVLTSGTHSISLFSMIIDIQPDPSA